MSLVLRGRSLCCAAVLFCSFSALAFAQLPTSLPALQPREIVATDRIEAELAKPFVIDVVDMPLRDLAAHIAEKSNVPVRLAKKIEDAGIQSDQPVTASAHNISLESFLYLMLADLNLTVMVKYETLTITTIEDAQSPENMVTRVYPVADLVRTADGQYDFDPLIDLITSTIEPDSWQDVGGPGSISGFDNSMSLVFSQRRDIHNRIEALLTTLRRVKRMQSRSMPLDSAQATEMPLSQSLKYSRGSNSPARFQMAPPAHRAQSGGGGLFSVPNGTAKSAARVETRAQPSSWLIPQVYQSAQ